MRMRKLICVVVVVIILICLLYVKFFRIQPDPQIKGIGGFEVENHFVIYDGTSRIHRQSNFDFRRYSK